ncbi:MAG TPA: flagellar biosynthesis protein FlhF [Burkholderiales bacterium]|nr:flagellar biosynthesis protein FlhF [Burkholderiales bacterium]
MNVKQFFAPHARDALREVKRELGADAVILSNRRVDGGVEILAIAHADARALETADREPVLAKAPAVRTATNNPAMPAARTVKMKMPAQGPLPRMKEASASTLVAAKLTQDPVAPVAQAAAPAQGDHIARAVIREIQSMRGLISEQLSGLVFGDMQRREPDKLRLMSTLLAGGFSPALSRRMLEKAPAGDGVADLKNWIKRALDKNLITSTADDIVAKGGVYALLGPTGVGKTTTTAKLAARCVVRHGADKLALLTTDNYRVGAHEHLRIYGRILGVSVHAVRDAADLEIALSELRNKHMVLIDTVGMSQKDQQVAEQVAMFGARGDGIRRLLLLNATCQGDTLEDVVNAYKGGGLAGCVITKTDEAASLGAVLDAVIRHRLPVHYVTNGQRVPEDIHPVNREYLLHRALSAARENPVRALLDQDLPAAMMGAEFAA